MKNPFITEMFIQHSHHSSASIIFSSQNYFINGPLTIKQNCNYKVFFQDPSDDRVLRTVSSQLK